MERPTGGPPAARAKALDPIWVAQPSADHVIVDAWEAVASAEGWANRNGVWGPRPQPPEAPRRLPVAMRKA